MAGGETWLVGVDGCRDGWLAVFVRTTGDQVRVRLVSHFSEVTEAPEAPVVVAVDMPIGLPERGGRDAERTVRPLVGKLYRSVFPVPSRRAVYSEIGPFLNQKARRVAHQRANAVARATSQPPRGITIQMFGILPKIREVDGILRGGNKINRCVYEAHPELAFWRLNGERALDEPKKIKGRPNEPGLEVRRRLLVAAGLPAAAVEGPPPKGAGRDDLLDALACAVIARRIHSGTAKPFPDPLLRDAHGLPMAIWS
jgi:predicted RNase H-like nuclease